MVGKTLHVSGFPLSATAKEVTEFLEIFTGAGSVYALKFRLPKVIKLKSRAYAVVQFESVKNAADITSIAQQSLLLYGGSYLKVRVMERDIVPKPREEFFVLEHAELHCGNLVSQERFSVLWTVADVKVCFGFNLRNICFHLSFGCQSFKFELSYASIWEIQLHRSPAQHSQFLVIQVQAAPRIYKRVPCYSDIFLEDPSFNYFRDILDEQWVRTTDFTPACSIGQSSALCLQISYDCKLPKIDDYFVYYRIHEGPFNLEMGFLYSRSLDLVPIVEPKHGIEVPYEVLFKVNLMVQHGILMGPTLDDEFFSLVSPRSVPINYIEHALENMSYLKRACFTPSKWLRESYKKFQTLNRNPKSPTISLDSGLVYVRRVRVTPSKVYFNGPEVNVSNRVLRNYSDDLNNFLRVSFVDEDWEKMHSTDLSPRSVSVGDEKHTEIYKRILSTLRNGIAIGDKKFEFLAFSSSQLRENSTWMFSSRKGLTAADIRKWMGDFHKIRNVAKYAARLGQSFGSSTETLTIGRDEVEMIPDIKNSEGYIFSDGIGKISADFSKRMAMKCNIKFMTTSAFQIRYGGCKGVVAVDPTSTKKLSLRKSMSKYESENTKLDVLAYSKYQPCYLNRQLITLLSTLGVGDHIFEMKQQVTVEQLDKIVTDPESALEAVENMSPGETTNILREMLLCGFLPDVEPLLSMLLQTFRAKRLLELRTKSRIFVQEGRSMMGCLDETRTLEYGEVFVQVSRIGSKHINSNSIFILSENESNQHSFVVKGRVIVAKNPCLHPGDIRILFAVDVPSLHHMVDCVVFPQKGKRPHPNECSGSDLDGDIYFVSWDHLLIPPRVVPPMEYTPAPNEDLDHEVTIEEVQEYFTNYMLNDSLGIIANAHTVFADKEGLKAESDSCIELARLFSIAVDFPKTGIPAIIPSHLYVSQYPDFMEKSGKRTYESKGVIGKLFRSIKDHMPRSGCIKAFTKETAMQSYDQDMEVEGFMDYLNEAFLFKGDYDFKLGNLMDHYGIKTEAEILSGSIMTMSKSYTKYKDGEAILLAVSSLRKEARLWFDEKSGDNGQDEDDPCAKASAWYHVTYHPDYWGCYSEELKRPHFLSFPWCVYDKLIQIKQRRMSNKKAKKAKAKLA